MVEALKGPPTRAIAVVTDVDAQHIQATLVQTDGGHMNPTSLRTAAWRRVVALHQPTFEHSVKKGLKDVLPTGVVLGFVFQDDDGAFEPAHFGGDLQAA